MLFYLKSLYSNHINTQINMTPANTEINVSISKHDVNVFMTNTPFDTSPFTVKLPTDWSLG